MNGIEAMAVRDFLEFYFDDFSFFLGRNYGVDETGAKEIIHNFERIEDVKEEAE